MRLLSGPSVLTGLSVLSAAVRAVPASGPEAAGGPVLEARFGNGPTVEIPDGGRVAGRSALGIETFNAIPYADPPVGSLRLRPPRRYSGSLGTLDGTGIAASCPQMWVSSAPANIATELLDKVLGQPWLQPIEGKEDCLTLNVQRPVGTKAGDKLPVLFWIFGGAFEFGGSAIYDGTDLMKAGIAQDQPFVLVAINHRVAGFGFMPGREVRADGSANLGLLDQRMALEWVADNIAAFGGDPAKVTIWGLSSGAISVFDQMLLYGGNATYRGRPLFRGAIMNSGSAAPANPVDCPKGQAVYDTVVAAAGCSGDPDSLACLRRLDYADFLRAANAVPGFFSYSSLNLAYLPRPDGVVLPDSPDALVAAGRFHAVPVIVGNQEDEGTIMSLFQFNLTTADDMVSYLVDQFFPTASHKRLAEFVGLYDPAILQGSPFRTGFLNEMYPGFKRVAAILGDLTFTMSRRVVFNVAARVRPDMPVWSYLSSYDHGTPFLGTFHSSDVSQIFFGLPPNHASRSCRTYYFNFLYNLDPNRGVGGYAHWPEWKESKDLMWFRWPWSNDIIKDDFRSGAAAWLQKNVGWLRI